MIELTIQVACVIFTAMIVTLLVLFFDDYIKRKRHRDYHITYEYKFFKYSYRETKRMDEELNALGKEGWEIASLAGEDSFYAYFILKRETLHTTKED